MVGGESRDYRIPEAPLGKECCKANRRRGVAPVRLAQHIFRWKLRELLANQMYEIEVRKNQDTRGRHEAAQAIEAHLQECALAEEGQELLRPMFCAERPESCACATCHDDYDEIPFIAHCHTSAPE